MEMKTKATASKKVKKQIRDKYDKDHANLNFRDKLNKSFEKTLDQSKIYRPIIKILNRGVAGIFILIALQALEIYLRFGS